MALQFQLNRDMGKKFACYCGAYSGLRFKDFSCDICLTDVKIHGQKSLAAGIIRVIKNYFHLGKSCCSKLAEHHIRLIEEL